MVEIRLEGQVAIVTGGSRGIGEATCRTLARNGAKVVVNDVLEEPGRRVSEEIRRGGGDALFHKADVSSFDGVVGMVDETIDRFGRLDILVNNAGVLGPYAQPIEDLDPVEWERLMNINLKGVFHCMKASLAPMKKTEGKIVNIASSAGRSTSTFGGAHYTTSKAGVLGLTRHWARATAKYGIRVNSICPGEIDTPMVRSVCPPERLEEIIRGIPIGRMGTPQDVANVILFLVSDLASYVTGATIDINGGSLLI